MSTPIVSGHAAIKCEAADCCMCRGTFAEMFCEWICPHCKAHLSKDARVCMNLCGLTVPQYQEFQSALAKHYDKETKPGL